MTPLSPPFDDPPSKALSFLGYSDTSGDDNLTVCGNCHVGVQAEWQETAHAGAWETLEASGQSQVFCEGCHTVSELGNTVTEVAGYNGSPEPRYHDRRSDPDPGDVHGLHPHAPGLLEGAVGWVPPCLLIDRGEIDATNPTFTTAEGAFFNWALAEFPDEPGSRADPRLVYAGSTVHNPFLMEQLLIASIRVVEQEYGVPVSGSLVLTPLLPGN